MADSSTDLLTRSMPYLIWPIAAFCPVSLTADKEKEQIWSVANQILYLSSIHLSHINCRHKCYAPSFCGPALFDQLLKRRARDDGSGLSVALIWKERKEWWDNEVGKECCRLQADTEFMTAQLGVQRCLLQLQLRWKLEEDRQQKEFGICRCVLGPKSVRANQIKSLLSVALCFWHSDNALMESADRNRP